MSDLKKLKRPAGGGCGALLAALAGRRENLIEAKPRFAMNHVLWCRLDAQIAELARTEKLVRDMAANDPSSGAAA